MVQVQFPDELLIIVREEREVFSQQVMLYTLGHLYTQGKISSGIAAEILGCTRAEFYRLLSQHGFSVIDYTPVEWQNEIQTSRQLAERILNQ